MEGSWLDRSLDRTALVYAASVASLVLGLIFIFVWAPHPWGWDGFDHYRDIAIELARGGSFPTLEVPWGYAYFLAGFYRLFGDHPWIPLLAQVALNALMPLLVFAIARTWLSRSTAVLAAILTGLFSFNTIYASTQSSDAVCTLLFMASVLSFVQARRRESWRWFAAVGLLAGLAPQFRPNLILIPALLAVFGLVERLGLRRLGHVALMSACAASALAPWVIRNYRLTRTVLPTSVHGGVQLWYGTLQAGPYLRSRAYNPRSVFESPAFSYTSLASVPLVVEAHVNPCAERQPAAASLVYWSDRDPQPRRVDSSTADKGTFTFEIPPPHQDIVLYYYFTVSWPPMGDEAPVQMTPAGGARTPFVYFVSDDHLGDLDVHDDLLDVFDIVRLVRHAAWNEPVRDADALRTAGVQDVGDAVSALESASVNESISPRTLAQVDHDAHEARLTWSDGSTITVPRAWSGRITDLIVSGARAERLMTSRASLAALNRQRVKPAPSYALLCAQLEDIKINNVFYRLQPQMMNRYMALSLDNIRRDPAAFVTASLYRALRLFVVGGSSDRHTAQQFHRSNEVYAVAMMASAAYLMLFGAGVIVCWRRHDDFWLPLLLILYVPATIAPVLINMRYTVTVQPLVFMFVAVAIMSGVERMRRDNWR